MERLGGTGSDVTVAGQPWRSGYGQAMSDDRLSGSGPGEFDPPRFSLSTAIYAERDDRKVLLLKRAEGSAMAGSYFLPGGVVDEGEEPYEGARRELREEAGLEIDGLTIVGAYPMWVYGRDFLMITFRGKVTGEVELSHEHLDHRWVDPEEYAATFTPEVAESIADGDARITNIVTNIGIDAQRYLATRPLRNPLPS
jgi:8-oxo-dGTP pyrophosphatase MutT (NUDIX family)